MLNYFFEKRIKDCIFFFLVLFLIFCHIPANMQVGFIGGVVGDKLVFWPILIGFLYTAYLQIKYKNQLVDFNIFRKYIIAYTSIILISTIAGLVLYPYYNVILAGPADQIEKLPRALSFLHAHGVAIEEKTLLVLWMIMRPIKGLFINTLFTFCGAYMIYCWYYTSWRRCFTIVLIGVGISLVVVISYCLLQLGYLLHIKSAENVLCMITPYTHMINTNHGWWPPVLWPGQLRSVFAEPSFFGIWSGFALPFVWYCVWKNKSNKQCFWLIVSIIFAFCIYMTNARTAVMIMLGEIVLLMAISSYFFYTRKSLMIPISKVLIIVSIGFCMMLTFDNIVAKTNNHDKFIAKTTAEQYIKSNIVSITNVNKRSNAARYSTIYANVMIGLDHPILGVGYNLTPAYMPEYFPSFAKYSQEVQNWIKYQDEKGVLKMGIPSFSAYSLMFAESGGVGLAIYILPALVLMGGLIRRILSSADCLPYVTVFLSLSGILASGMSNNLNVTYCYWVLLGLGYAMCFGKQRTEETDDK